MKKTTLLIAAFLMAWGVKTNAQLNNPLDANGNQIYRWDCANDKFATSNNFEIDETIVFAVDVTGSPLEAWLKVTPPKTGEIRSIAFDFNTQWGGGGCDGRFVQIKGNIYGCTLNFAQLITSRQNQIALLNVGDAKPGGNAFTIGTAVVLNSNIFGFGYTPTDTGAEWWQLPMQLLLGANVTTAPYTGTKTSVEFYKTDTNDSSFFPGSFTDWMGYAAPCATLPTAVRNVFVSNSPVVAHEYYTILGNKLSIKPVGGMYIEKSIREDGTSSTIKVFKQSK